MKAVGFEVPLSRLRPVMTGIPVTVIAIAEWAAASGPASLRRRVRGVDPQRLGGVVDVLLVAPAAVAAVAEDGGRHELEACFPAACRVADGAVDEHEVVVD